MNPEKCICCGMPMETEEQHSNCDPAKDFCIYCTDAEGNMKTFEQKVNDMTEFIMKRTGITKEEASQTAKFNLMKLPYWQKMRGE